MIVWERMEGLDEELAFPLFEMYIADGTERDTSAGIERINHPFGSWAMLQLVLKHPEHIGRYVIEFELGTVFQASLALDFLHVFPSQAHLEQFALLRKRLLQGANDFGHGRATATGECDHMTIAGNINTCAVVSSSDQPGSMIVEQFRMDRSAKDAQRMFRYGRPDG